MVGIRASDRVHARYREYVSAQEIAVRPGPFIGSQDKVFTIGSCFAREIRFALRGMGIAVSPHYRQISFDPKMVRVDNLPDEEHMNYYNAFAVLQEIERAAGLWVQNPEDYWTLRSSKIWPGETTFQDPYRRLIVGRTPEALRKAVAEVNRVVREAFRDADAFLITYGMIEVFRDRRSGKIVAQKPLYGGGGGQAETEFWQSSFDDNLQAVRRTVELITEHNPAAKIFVTVSPVALERTFSDADIFVANSEGKSTLRAVLGQVSREFPAVTYFPAYEAVMSGGAASFRDDGRHVLAPVVQGIMRGFVDAHVRLQRAY